MKLAQLFEAVKTESFIDAEKLNDRWGELVGSNELRALGVSDLGPSLIAYNEQKWTAAILYKAKPGDYLVTSIYNFMSGRPLHITKYDESEDGYEEALVEFNKLKRSYT